MDVSGSKPHNITLQEMGRNKGLEVLIAVVMKSSIS
jgi:hypothetical protein